MEVYEIEKKKLPVEFHYPPELIKIINLNLVDLDPWYVMQSDEAFKRFRGVQKRYPKRILIPFARRQDNDDVACFEVNQVGTVQLIHDFATSGYEQRKNYESFWEWFKDAIEEMIIFD